MKKLYVMIGCPGSGKSTWIKEHFLKFSDYTKIISRDEIRFRLITPNEDYFSKEKEVFRIFIEEIKDNLEYEGNTIVDATHITAASRNKLFKSLGSSLKDVEVIGIVIDVSLAVALEQNEMRKGRACIPPTVIKRMYSQFEMPKLEEGFDKIYIYNPNYTPKYRYVERG